MTHRSQTRVTLVATYELGRQPFGLASPAAWLRQAGIDVRTIDLSRETFRDELFDSDVIAFHLPMHTATRLAVPVIRRVRTLAPAARLCGYGLYAPLNASILRELGVEHVLGGEFEQALLDLVCDRTQGPETVEERGQPRLHFRVPDRRDLPPLDQYVSLQMPSGDRRVVGYTEASRGCKHRCRHCPVVPIYDGQFRVVPREVVLEDIRAQVDAGAQHITFGDPDFFNGIGHALNIVNTVHREFPDLTYDVTIKIEHLRQHDDHLGILRETGCLFVVSAVESIDDAVLQHLEKGHSRSDFHAVVARCRQLGLVLTPTFIPFTPWTTLSSYCEFLRTIDRLDLVEQIAPVQLMLRLLIPAGSRLLELNADTLGTELGTFDSQGLVYPWSHQDPRVDRLQESLAAVVGRWLSAPRSAVFGEVARLALAASDNPERPIIETSLRPRSTVPYLNEPWYC